MERNEFIKSLGLGIALVCTGSCLSSCGGKGDDAAPSPGGGGGPTGPPPGTKVNVDLNTQLTTVGSSLTSNGVLFVRLAAGSAISAFTATQAICPHQGGTLGWMQANNLIQCSLHSSQYSSSGAVLSQPQDGGVTTALSVYALSITGNTLTATVG